MATSGFDSSRVQDARRGSGTVVIMTFLSSDQPDPETCRGAVGPGVVGPGVVGEVLDFEEAHPDGSLGDEEIGDEEVDDEEASDVLAGPTETLSSLAEGSLLILSARWVPLARVLAALAEQLRSKGVVVIEIDVDAKPGLADQLRVASLPTFCYLGKEGPEMRLGASSLGDLLALCGR